MDINVNVEIGEIDLLTELTSHYDEDGDRIGAGTLGDLVVAKLVDRAVATKEYGQSITERVRAIRDEEIRTQVAPIIAEAIQTPIEQTNSWGERNGKQTTLRELIMTEVRSALGARNGDYTRSGSSDRETALAKHIRTEVNAALKAEIADAVVAAKQAVAKEFGASIGEAVTKAVTEGLKR